MTEENGQNAAAQLTLLKSIDERLTRLEEVENARRARRVTVLCVVLAVLALLTAVLLPRARRTAARYRATVETLQQIGAVLPPERLRELDEALSTIELPELAGLEDAIDCLGTLDTDALQSAMSTLGSIDPAALQKDLDTLRGLMDGLQQIDAAELSRAVKNLNIALEPILRLFGKDNG